MQRRTIAVAIAASLLAVAAGHGCQEVEQPSPMLTKEQMKKVNEHIYDYAQGEDPPKKIEDPKQAPEPEYKIGANYQNKIRFLGFSVGNPDKNDPVVAGERTTIRWYWKAMKDMDENWKIFVHFDSKETNVKPAKRRQNLDHHPLDGLYPTSKWPKGKIIEDVQKVKIRDDYPGGPAVPYVGFFRGKSRLSIENDVRKTNDRRVKAPTLEVINKGGGSKNQKKKGKPTYTVSKLDDEAADKFEVDGKLDETFWENVDALELSPFGGGDGLKSRIKVTRSKEALVVGAHLEDEHVWSNKEKRDSNTWEEEVVEMFIDTDGDGKNYLELQINPVGTIFDANFKQRLGTGDGSRTDQIDRAKQFDLEGLESAVHVEGTVNDREKKDEFWSVELKIPLTSIPGVESTDELGEKWAVNFYRFDRPTDKKTLSFAWNTAPRGDFHQVSKFGVFKFGSGDEKKVDVPEALQESIKRKQLPKPKLKPGEVPTPPGSSSKK